jgi:hypothetical protein
MSTTIERTDYFTRSSWADMSASNNDIESELQTDASVEQAIRNMKHLVGLLQGYTVVPVTFRRAFSKTYDRSVDAVLAPVKLSSRSSEELVEMQYQDIYQEFLNAFQLGLTGEVVAIKHLLKGLIEYTIRLSNQTKDLQFRSVGMVKDGKIVLVERQETHYSDQTLVTWSKQISIPAKEATVETLVVGEIITTESEGGAALTLATIITALVETCHCTEEVNGVFTGLTDPRSSVAPKIEPYVYKI